MEPVLLRVRHRSENKMVGKIFCVSGTWLCLHEESGTQKLLILDSPGGVDVVAAQFCQQHGVQEWHHYNRSDRVLYRCQITTLRTKGIERRFDGRKRLFLPKDQWTRTIGLPYTPPWIKAERVIDADDIDTEDIASAFEQTEPEIYASFDHFLVAEEEQLSLLTDL